MVGNGADVVALNTDNATGAFEDAVEGTGKAVSVSGLTIGGADVGNYTLTLPTVIADITTDIVQSQTTNNQLSNVMIFRPLPPPLDQSGGGRQFNFFNPMGPVYFYHPVTFIDASAFEGFNLEAGAYDFIDGHIGNGGLPLYLR